VKRLTKQRASFRHQFSADLNYLESRGIYIFLNVYYRLFKRTYKIR
jgi:hypothetical protein